MAVTELETTVDRSVRLAEDTERELENGRLTHIVPPDWNEKGEVIKEGHIKVMEARYNGTPVTALCGYTWIPQHDPQNFPICSKCVEIAEAIKKNPDNMRRY